MEIVVLDGYTLNPGDLSWKELEALGNCTIYDRTAAAEIVPRIKTAELVLTNKTPLSGDVITASPLLRYIGVLATGYNIVDAAAARERNIPVTNVPEYGTQSVAQMVFAHLLNLTRRVAHHAQTVKNGRWSKNPDWCYWDYPMIELSGLTMGIIGLGRIGQATAGIAHGFGMKVLASDPIAPQEIPYGVQLTDIGTLFKESDVISLHCPLLPETRHIVNRAHLALMKPSAFLINTSRGPLIDEEALAEALNGETIAGAGLDVLSVEPPQAANRLFHAKNCHITPHISWATKSARSRLLDTVVENIKAFLDGNSQNVVN